jgi:signal peptidase I
MDDDESMRDRVAGRRGPEDQAPAAAADESPDRPVAAGGAARADTSDTPGAPGAKPGGKKRRRSFWRELPILIVVALAIALLIKTFVVQAFFIPSSSMENTLLIGDKVLVNKVVYHLRPIKPGDIIVFDGAGSWNPVLPPTPASSDPIVRLYKATLLPLFRSIGGLFGTAPGQTDYIKRVIGIPGDHVACCTAQGLVTVNGVALHEGSYLYPGAQPSQIRFNITVPPGRLWVMGDNRLISDDSRLHRDDPGSGTVPENKVIGRAFMIVWPPSRWTILSVPSTFQQAGIGNAAAAAGPSLPLAGGVVVALPLTWLQRRARQRLRRGRARR